MIVIVKFLVNGGIGRAEIGAQVNDRLARFPQNGSVWSRRAMGHRQEKKIGLFRQREVGRGVDKGERSHFGWEAGNELGKRLAGVLPGSDQADLKYRMPGEVTKKLLPGIPGSANNRRTYGLQLGPFSFRLLHERTERTLAFGELEALARAGLSGLFAFLFAGIATK